MKQTVTKMHLNFEFDSNSSLCNLLRLNLDLFPDCDRNKKLSVSNIKTNTQ